jgi:hypothetical protein
MGMAQQLLSGSSERYFPFLYKKRFGGHSKDSAHMLTG